MLVLIDKKSIWVETVEDFSTFIPSSVYPALQEWADSEIREKGKLLDEIEKLKERIVEYEHNDDYYDGFSEGRDVGYEEGYKAGHTDAKNGRRTRRIKG
ncbi:TPA: hypothetical protein ACGO1T_001047 [Streptococcus suis]